MTTPANHIIKRQVLDITLSDATDQPTITEEITEFYKSNIDSIIDKATAGIIPATEIISFDKIEIDLGTISLANLKYEFPKAIEKALKEQLYKQIRDKQTQNNRSVVSVSERHEAALLFYFQNGTIPWWYSGDLQKLKANLSAFSITELKLLPSIVNDQNYLKRAFSFYQKILSLELLQQIIPTEKQQLLLQLSLLQSILTKLDKSTQKTISARAQLVLKSIQINQNVDVDFIADIVYHSLAETSSGKVHLVNILPHPTQKELINLFQKTEIFDSIELHSKEENYIREFSKNFREKTKTEDQFHPKEIKNAIHLEDGIDINNAGLVLIWPYLQPFFTGLGLVKEKTFVDESSATKAVHLLHYLVYQNQKGFEWEWVLNKLFCGLNSTHFIPDKINLTETEKEECDNLLNAVIKNWGALKGTSIAGLQQTFLSRSGMLYRNGNDWQLKVEKQTYDILLDKLPWGISIVKLPWNDYMIYTEW